MTVADLNSTPAGIPARPIHERQLDDDMLKIQRAASASHRRGQRLEAVRNTAALVLAGTGLLVTAIDHGRVLFTTLGVLWFLVSFFVLRTAMANTAQQGAQLQEQFDTALFHLPWRLAVAGDPVPEHDIAHLARTLQVGGKRDLRITSGWYDPTGGVHYPLDVLIAQEQNLAWDARLRRSYAACVVSAAILWVVVGATAVGYFGGATIPQAIASFYAPSLAALQLSMEIAFGQRKVANERERLAKIVLGELRNARSGPLPPRERDRLRHVARDVQDGIYRTRQDVSRVPEWFYRLRRDTDERDFGDTAEGRRQRLAE